MGVGDLWGWVGSRRRLKANIQTQRALIGDPYWHNSQGRPGLPLESVCHPMQSY